MRRLCLTGAFRAPEILRPLTSPFSNSFEGVPALDWRSACTLRRVSDHRFVYILMSTVHANRYYTGSTSDVAARLAAHNAGLSKHTASGKPWKIVTTIEFSDSDRAEAFEKYLKSGSGRAFARRYFR